LVNFQFPGKKVPPFSFCHISASSQPIASKIELYILLHILNVLQKFQIDRMFTRILRFISTQLALNYKTIT
jgi:hypothetical protein